LELGADPAVVYPLIADLLVVVRFNPDKVFALRDGRSLNAEELLVEAQALNATNAGVYVRLARLHPHQNVLITLRDGRSLRCDELAMEALRYDADCGAALDILVEHMASNRIDRVTLPDGMSLTRAELLVCCIQNDPSNVKAYTSLTSELRGLGHKQPPIIALFGQTVTAREVCIEGLLAQADAGTHSTIMCNRLPEFLRPDEIVKFPNGMMVQSKKKTGG
jgi:hypothetical protein